MEARIAADPLHAYDEKSRKNGLYIVAARYDARSRMIQVTLKAGMTISFPKERAQSLANATDDQLSELEISPAGWSVDFPHLDDGITLEGLLSGRFGNDRWEQEWAAKQQQLAAA